MRPGARPGAHHPAPRLDRAGGFTLLELLVCLALLALLAMVSLPQVSGSARGARLAADQRVVAALLREARERALAERQRVQVVVDLGNRRVTVEGGRRTYSLSAVDHLAVETEKGRVTSGEAVIAFHPDGGSSGGAMVSEAGGAQRILRVDWLTGAVTLDGG